MAYETSNPPRLLRVGDVVLVVNSTSGVPYVTGISTVNDSSAATVVPSTAT
jgi:hypothetical protein